MDTNRGAPSDSAPPAESTPPAESAPVLLTPEQQDKNFQAEAAKASSPAAIRALTEAAVRQGGIKPPLPTKQPEAAKPGEAAPEGNPPEGTPPETPVEGEAPPEGEKPPETPPEEDDDEPEGDEVRPVEAKKARITPRDDDEVGRLAIAFQRRNRDWTLEQSMEAARKKLGKDQPPANQPASDPDKPATLEATNARLVELRAERRKAGTELQFEKSDEITTKIEDLLGHRNNLERAGEREQQQAAATYERAFAASDAKATELYPDAGNPESAFAKRMMEIEQDLETMRDPLFGSPDKPLRIAQMVAAELNIAPKRKGATAARPAGAPPPPPTPQKKNVLPAGGSGTVPPKNAAVLQQEAAIQGVRTLGDLRKLQKSLGIST